MKKRTKPAGPDTPRKLQIRMPEELRARFKKVCRERWGIDMSTRVRMWIHETLST